MEIEQVEAVWLEKQGNLSVTGLSELSGLPQTVLLELVAYGALDPVDPNEADLMFAGHCVRTVRIASRLQHDFELDSQSLALALSLVDRIHQLETELRQLRVLIPHRSS